MKIPSLTLLLLTVLSIFISFSHCTEPETFLQLVTSKPRTLTQLRFHSFIKKYNKSYLTPSEYAHRFTIFSINLAKAAKNQALDPTAKHGVTKFFDLTEEEFQTQYLGLAVSPEAISPNLVDTAQELNPEGLPHSFDWRQRGAVTDVKMQGVCGSCWAFSTTGAVEGANFLATGKLLNLSEQQLVDCDHTCDAVAKKECNNGCGGGLMTNAYNYLMKSGGLQEERSYPYTGKQGECRFDEDKVVVRVKNFTKVPFDEEQIAANLVARGPLAIGLNAAFMQTYVGGVSCPLICPKMFINHGVLLVGYGARGFSILRLGYQPYWIVKNSWGKNWGEGGYYRLCKGRHMCGMNTMVSAVAVESY